MFHLIRRFVPKTKSIINIFSMSLNLISRDQFDILTGTRYGFSQIKTVQPAHQKTNVAKQSKPEGKKK